MFHSILLFFNLNFIVIIITVVVDVVYCGYGRSESQRASRYALTYSQSMASYSMLIYYAFTTHAFRIEREVLFDNRQYFGITKL